MTASDRVYLVLIASWLLLDVVLMLAPESAIPAGQAVDASRLMLDVGLATGGWIALRAAQASGFASLWTPERRASEFLLPAIAGLALGCIPALLDVLAPIGDIHADLPIGIVNYYVGGIFSEVMFRLIPVGLLVWLGVTYLGGAGRETAVFWSVALLVGAYEPVVSWQIISDPNGSASFDGPLSAFAFVATAYVLNVGAAYAFWTRGFLAALVVRWTFYLVWHVAWPLVWY